MRFVVVGAGGVGGYFGARLAAAGYPVAFIARGAHGDAMARHGLRLRSALGDLEIAAPTVFSDPAEAGPADVILVCVKMRDLEPLAPRLRPLLAPETAVVPLQNGVEAEDRLGAILGREHVLGGVAYIFAHIAEPGTIQHVGTLAGLVFGERGGLGELGGRRSDRPEALRAACAEAGIEAEASDGIDVRIWRKFALLAPLAGATCLGRCPVGGVRDDPVLWAKLEAMIGEVAALGRARGVSLPDDLEARTLAAVRQLDADMKTSMLTDLEAGKPLELEWLNGAVVRLGAEAGLETPANGEAVAKLAPFADGAA